MDERAAIDGTEIAIRNVVSHAILKRKSIDSSNDAIAWPKTPVGDARVEQPEQRWEWKAEYLFCLMKLLFCCWRKSEFGLGGGICLKRKERTMLNSVIGVKVAFMHGRVWVSLSNYQPCDSLTMTPDLFKQSIILVLTHLILLAYWLNECRLLFLAIFFLSEPRAEALHEGLELGDLGLQLGNRDTTLYMLLQELSIALL